MQTQKYILLLDGTAVHENFYNSIFQQVDEIIPAMKLGKPYTAKTLCGPEFWEGLGSKQRLAGQCISNMVYLGQLPLQVIGCEHQFPRKYRRK